MAKLKQPKLKSEKDQAEFSPWRRYKGDIRIWLGIVLLPLVLFIFAEVFALGSKEEPVLTTECHYEDWIGKQYDLQAIRKTGRPYRFVSKGGTMPPAGDEGLINIELLGTTVTKIWCG